jgi:hypothetical protein
MVGTHILRVSEVTAKAGHKNTYTLALVSNAPKASHVEAINSTPDQCFPSPLGE